MDIKVTHRLVSRKHATGTGYRGTYFATMRELVDTFGEPEDIAEQSDGKVQWSWTLMLNIAGSTRIVTIYDYKTERSIDGDEMFEWHIGGNTDIAVEYVEQQMRGAK